MPSSSAAAVPAYCCDQLPDKVEAKACVEAAVDVDRRDGRKKQCSCGAATDGELMRTAGSNGGSFQTAFDAREEMDSTINYTPTNCTDNQPAVATTTMPISIKIEDSSPSPSLSHPSADLTTSSPAHTVRQSGHSNGGRCVSSSGSGVSCKTSRSPNFTGRSDGDVKHARSFVDQVKPVKSRCASPGLVEVQVGRSRSRSRSPLSQHHQSRNRMSRHSVEIKTERTTPSLSHKKTSSHASTTDRFTPHHTMSSSSGPPPPASFPLYTPSAVPASYFSASRPAFPGFDASGMSYPYRSLPSHGSLFAPGSMGLHPSLSSQLMMGLPGQFGGQDPILSANQDMLTRMQQELNARFLHDRSLLPLGMPPVPFTLHTEMHQHQHLHHHQHVLPPGAYLSSSAPSASSLFPNPMSMKLGPGNDLLIHSQNLSELAERERLAKMAGLSGFPGLGMTQGLSQTLPFGQGLHAGAFQPKAGTTNISNLNPASQLLLSLREQENLTRSTSLSSVSKKRGRWCAAHVQIAYKIQFDMQNRSAEHSALRGGIDSTKNPADRLLGPNHLLGMSAGNSGLPGHGDPRSGFIGPGGLFSRHGEPNNMPFGGLGRTDAGNLFGPSRGPSGSSLLQTSSGRNAVPRSPPPPVGMHSSPSRNKPPDMNRDVRRDNGDMRDRHLSSHHAPRIETNLSRDRDHHRTSSSHMSSSLHTSRSPDRHASHHLNRSRSRSPHHQSRHVRQMSDAAREAELRFGQPFMPGEMSLLSDASRMNGFPPGMIPGHAFSTVPPPHSKPSAASASLNTLAAIDLDREARKLQFQQQERDRLSSLVGAGFAPPLPQLLSGANCDALLRDRMMMTERDRMMFAAAAAAEMDGRPMRPVDPAMRPALGGLYPPPSDSILGGASAMLAQSALLRPGLGRPSLPMQPPGLKLPGPFGAVIDSSMMDPTAAALNLPFR